MSRWRCSVIPALLLISALFISVAGASSCCAAEKPKSEKHPVASANTTCVLPLSGQYFAAKDVAAGNFSIDLTSAFTTQQVAQVENNIKACQSLISSRLLGFQDKGSLLMQDKASIQGMQNIKTQIKRLEALKREKDDIKNTLSKDISQVTLKGLYAVVLEADLKTPRDKLLDMAKNMIVPQAIHDLRGVSINSVSVVKESRLEFDRIVAETSGEMDVETILADDRKSFFGKSQLLYVAVVRVKPLTGKLKHETTAKYATKGFVADLLSLQKNTEFFSQELAKYTNNPYSAEKMKSLEEIVSVWQDVIQQGNAQANKKTGELLANLNNQLKAKDEEIEAAGYKIGDSRKKLSELFNLTRYTKCQLSPEECLDDAIANIDQEFSKLINASITEKEREYVSSRGIVTGSGDPEKEVKRLVQDFYQNLKTSYSVREQILNVTMVDNAMLTGDSDKRGYYVVRNPKGLTIFPYYDDNGNMHTMVVMNFLVNREDSPPQFAKEITPIPTSESTPFSESASTPAPAPAPKSKSKQPAKSLRKNEPKATPVQQPEIIPPEEISSQPPSPQPAVVLPRSCGPDNLTKMKFVLVKGGCYTMGNNSSSDTQSHEVCVSSFCIGKYEVTQGEWKIVTGENPSKNKSGDDYPVENVSWPEAKSFLVEMNKKSGKNYRLPTEAEWEFAARSRGGNEVWSGTSSETALENFAWIKTNSQGKSHPVGKKKPNKLGIFDMTGNVWEWMEDSYSSDAYRKLNKDNPVNASDKSSKVRRGGSFETDSRKIKNSDRDGHRQGRQSDDHGFRVVYSVAESAR